LKRLSQAFFIKGLREAFLFVPAIGTTTGVNPSGSCRQHILPAPQCTSRGKNFCRKCLTGSTSSDLFADKIRNPEILIR